MQRGLQTGLKVDEIVIQLSFGLLSFVVYIIYLLHLCNNYGSSGSEWVKTNHELTIT